MSLSEDQRYFMSILRETGVIRLDQVLPLLRINEPQKEPSHAGAMLRRLQCLGLLTKAGEDVICLPKLRNEPPNRERLLALDTLLCCHLIYKLRKHIFCLLVDFKKVGVQFVTEK